MRIEFRGHDGDDLSDGCCHCSDARETFVDMGGMTRDVDIPFGRALAYHLFADFFRDGLTVATCERFAALPEIRPLIPEIVDTDAWGAAHYALLGMDVLPCAGWYLDEQALLGGRSSAIPTRARDAFLVEEQEESAEHISSELHLLARMCELEAVGHDTSDEQRRFMDDHFLWWVLPFAFAICRSCADVYAAVAALMVDVVVDHRIGLGGGLPCEQPIPEMRDILEREDTGIREIAGHLSTVALCGLVVTRRLIESIGRECDIPRGFGNRRQMLSNLLRAAAQYDRVREILDHVAGECEVWCLHYDGLIGSEAEPISVVAKEWKRRIEATARMIGAVRARAATTTC